MKQNTYRDLKKQYSIIFVVFLRSIAIRLQNCVAKYIMHSYYDCLNIMLEFCQSALVLLWKVP